MLTSVSHHDIIIKHLGFILYHFVIPFAVIAQSVVHYIGSVEVTGSIPVNSLPKQKEYCKTSSSSLAIFLLFSPNTYLFLLIPFNFAGTSGS